MFITTSIGNLYPESMLALHLNFILAMPPPLTKSPLGFVRFLTTHMLNLYTPQEQAGLKAAKDYQENGGYYLHMMRTRPQTIGAMLADSPIALLAWIYEKLIAWTDDYPWTDQEVCEWVSLYRYSRAGPAASVNIYHEMFQGEWQADTGRAIPKAKLVSGTYSLTRKDFFLMMLNICRVSRTFQRKSPRRHACGTDSWATSSSRRSTRKAATSPHGSNQRHWCRISGRCSGQMVRPTVCCIKNEQKVRVVLRLPRELIQLSIFVDGPIPGWEGAHIIHGPKELASRSLLTFINPVIIQGRDVAHQMNRRE